MTALLMLCEYLGVSEEVLQKLLQAYDVPSYLLDSLRPYRTPEGVIKVFRSEIVLDMVITQKRPGVWEIDFPNGWYAPGRESHAHNLPSQFCLETVLQYLASRKVEPVDPNWGPRHLYGSRC